MVAGIGFQIPWWVAVPVLIVLLFGAWKLVKFVLAALSN
jgi:hypothetical protein